MLLAIWIAVALVFEGVSEIVLGVSHREAPGRGWLVAGGVLGVIAGIVMLAWPFGSIVVLTLAAGIWLVIIGIWRIVAALRARRETRETAARHPASDTAASPPSP